MKVLRQSENSVLELTYNWGTEVTTWARPTAISRWKSITHADACERIRQAGGKVTRPQ